MRRPEAKRFFLWVYLPLCISAYLPGPRRRATGTHLKNSLPLEGPRVKILSIGGLGKVAMAQGWGLCQEVHLSCHVHISSAQVVLAGREETVPHFHTLHSHLRSWLPSKPGRKWGSVVILCFPGF